MRAIASLFSFSSQMTTGILCVLAFALVGCSADTPPTGRSVVIQITSPTDGSEFTTNSGKTDIDVRISATPFEGEVKALLDGEIVGTFDSGGSYSFRDVGIGPHDLTAQAVQLDGTPYGEPNSEATISVVVVSPCESDADCDDNNECTEERCQDGGICSYSLIPDCESTTPPGAECKTNSDCADKVDGLGVCKQPYCDIENDYVCIVVPSRKAPIATTEMPAPRKPSAMKGNVREAQMRIATMTIPVLRIPATRSKAVVQPS